MPEAEAPPHKTTEFFEWGVHDFLVHRFEMFLIAHLFHPELVAFRQAWRLLSDQLKSDTESTQALRANSELAEQAYLAASGLLNEVYNVIHDLPSLMTDSTGRSEFNSDPRIVFKELVGHYAKLVSERLSIAHLQTKANWPTSEALKGLSSLATPFEIEEWKKQLDSALRDSQVPKAPIDGTARVAELFELFSETGD